MPWEEFPDFQFPLQKNVKENSPRKHEAAGPKVQGSDSCKPRKCQHFPHFNSSSDPEKEVTDLKDQLEALKCQVTRYGSPEVQVLQGKVTGVWGKERRSMPRYLLWLTPEEQRVWLMSICPALHASSVPHRKS